MAAAAAVAAPAPAEEAGPMAQALEEAAAAEATSAAASERGAEPGADGGPGRRLRLVASDLDGTLLDVEESGGCVSAETVAALHEVVGPGCPLALVTARSAMELMPFAELPDPLYLLTCGGAEIHERRGGVGSAELQQLRICGLAEAEARAAAAAIEAERATVVVLHADRVLVKGDGPEGEKGLDAWLPGIFRSANMLALAREVEDFEEVRAFSNAMELCAIVKDADACCSGIRAALEAAGHGLDVLSFAPDPIVSIKAPGVDKAAALGWLCDHVGVAAQDVVAFGDGTNDVPMLRFAGLGVAVANAGPAAREAADVLSPWRNTEGAVARELARLRAEGRL